MRRFGVLVSLLCRLALAECDSIPAVQGDGARSPCEGQTVTVTGVVTASFAGLSGFFLQDPAGDGNAATSDAIFVFTGSAGNLPEPGALLRVVGKVAEFARAGRVGSVTELDTRGAPAFQVLGSAPVPVATPLDPPLDAEEYLEAREGMLVAYPLSAVVTPSNEFGEFYALRYDRAPLGMRPTAEEPGAGLPVLIDRAGGAVRRDLKIFDLVPPLTGALHFDFGSFRLEPLAPYTPQDAGWTPVPAPPERPFLSAASLNCERLLPTLKPDEGERKLRKLSLAIRDQLRSPDILAVQEVGNLELLEQLGSRAGVYRAVLLPGCDFSGINVGLLYNPARFRLLSASQYQAEAPEFRKPACTLPDGRVFARPMFDRPPLRVDLAMGSIPLTVVVNHWRSQIGGRDEQRAASGAYLALELSRLGNLIVLGDFNEDERQEGMRALADVAGLVNLTPTVAIESCYSYTFEGRSEALDHILLSPGLASKVWRAGFAHFNADFPKVASEDGATPVRVSDHDSPWVYLRQ